MNNTIYIEFIGLPASGKSTVVNMLSEVLAGDYTIKRLKSERIERKNSVKKIQSNIEVMVRNPVRFIKIFMIALLNPVHRNYLGVDSFIKRLDRIKSLWDGEKAIILDEGLIHLWYQYFFGRSRIVGISMLYKMVSDALRNRQPVFIYLDLNVTEGIRRFKEREGVDSRFSAKSGDKIIRQYKQSIHLYEYILNYLQRYYRDNLFVVDSGGNATDVTEKVRKIISSMVDKEREILIYS